ncbi:MAG: pili assembly chaperone, partial [Candidatus Acidiferrales bacterium]
ISTAEVVYSTTYGIGFSPTLAAVGGNTVIVDQNNAGLIDSVLSTGIKSGYTFTYNVISQDGQGHVTSYTVNGDPLTSSSGTRHFFIDQTAVIRANYTASAGASDAPIQ